MPRTGKRWSFSDGDYGHTVAVWEETNGRIYGRRPGERKRSLGHSDRVRAKHWAKDEAAKLVLGQSDVGHPIPAFDKVVGWYLEYQAPKTIEKNRPEHFRRAVMWRAFLGQEQYRNTLGKQLDLSELTLQQCEDFKRLRASGERSGRWQWVKPSQRKAVGPTTVASDLAWLRCVILWAMKWKEGKHYLMREDPTRGWEIPKEKNPNRPVASQDRYEAVRAVSDQVLVSISGRSDVRSYLSEVLDIANGTARRIRAILALQYADLDLNIGQHGGIRWRHDTDKTGKEWFAPINASVRAAIQRTIRERPGVGRAHLFPGFRQPQRPLPYHTALDWLHRAERLAGIEPLKRGAFHPYRRKWACERKDLPDVDVAQVGGWSNLQTLKAAYQQPDWANMERVVSQPTELREAK